MDTTDRIEMGVFRNQSGDVANQIVDGASQVGKGLFTLLFIGVFVTIATKLTS